MEVPVFISTVLWSEFCQFSIIPVRKERHHTYVYRDHVGESMLGLERSQRA